MFIADLHLHSAYSRATSRDCGPIQLDASARRKGLHLVASGDFTHAAYRAELAKLLHPAEDGLYSLKDDQRLPLEGALSAVAAPRFIISGEISSIYKQDGRTRKIHNVILLPSLEAAEKVSAKLEALGCNLRSDGRPIIGLSAHDLLELTLDSCDQAIFIPAHIWTPHFSLFGAYSGFDCIEDCFGDLTEHIHALETGLSSDPPMNWRWSALDKYTLVSNSDAHSPGKLGREANLFNCEMSYPDIAAALADRAGDGFAGTLEFFPEEGKYHADGHRNCHVCLSPAETDALDGVCPVCGRQLTRGVWGRCVQLSDRPENFRPDNARPFRSLIPLEEIIAAALGLSGTASAKVQRQYAALLTSCGPELDILLNLPPEDIAAVAGPCVSESLRRLREGKVQVSPGYDGEYGRVSILSPADRDALIGQDNLFGGLRLTEPAQKKALVAKKQPAAVTPPGQPAAEPLTLNAEQQQAVTTTTPAVAVIAGPGTGKTRTLIQRLLHLLDSGVSTEQIMAVTFTNKAAEELRQRIAAQLPEQSTAKELRIGTFHSLALGLLREQARNTTVLSPPQALELAELAIAECGQQRTPRAALKLISQLKCGRAAGDAEQLELLDEYCRLQNKYQALDFDDILLTALELPAPAGLQHILVDEFQDIDDLQFRLIRHWANDTAHIFVIGDPDQSIYSFRGANSGCFAKLAAVYPQLQTINLSINYRSGPHILNAALNVISAKGKERRLIPIHQQGEKVRLQHCAGQLEEGVFVAKEISRLLGGVDMLQAHAKAAETAACALSDIAILYRTHQQSEQLELCLQQEGLPYVVSGRGDELDSPVVADALSWFRFLLDPADLLSFSSCLKQAGAQPDVREQLVSRYAQVKKPALAAALKLLQQQPDAQWPELLGERLRRQGQRVRRAKPEALVREYIADSMLYEVQPLETLAQTASSYVTMPALLQALTFGEDADVLRRSGKAYQQQAIRLMTLHAAKGLEFPVVFLAGLREGALPLQAAGKICDPDEERRLCFVGMTRATKLLYLLAGEPISPFAAALPASDVETLKPRQRREKWRQMDLFDNKN